MFALGHNSEAEWTQKLKTAIIRLIIYTSACPAEICYSESQFCLLRVAQHVMQQLNAS